MEKDCVQTCSYCNIENKESAVMLQCGHSLHYECSKKMMVDKFGEEFGCVSIDKTKIWTDLKGEKYNIMTFGTDETDGIFTCPHEDCAKKYSIICPIYKQFGIPKRIDKIILFAYNEEVVCYHICTNIDLIHLLDSNLQHELLKIFDYDNEFKILGDHVGENGQIMLLGKFDDFIFHAVMCEGVFTVFPETGCPVCYHENIDDVFEHASIADYLNFINPNKLKLETSSVSSNDDFSITPPISPKK